MPVLQAETPSSGGLLRPSPGREQGAGGPARAAVAQTGAMSLPSVFVHLLRQHVSPFSSRALGREWDGRGARGEGGRAGKASRGRAECWGARSETRAGTVPPCLPAPAGDECLRWVPAQPRPGALLAHTPSGSSLQLRDHMLLFQGNGASRPLCSTRDTPGLTQSLAFWGRRELWLPARGGGQNLRLCPRPAPPTHTPPVLLCERLGANPKSEARSLGGRPEGRGAGSALGSLKSSDYFSNTGGLVKLQSQFFRGLLFPLNLTLLVAAPWKFNLHVCACVHAGGCAHRRLLQGNGMDNRNLGREPGELQQIHLFPRPATGPPG